MSQPAITEYLTAHPRPWRLLKVRSTASAHPSGYSLMVQDAAGTFVYVENWHPATELLWTLLVEAVHAYTPTGAA